MSAMDGDVASCAEMLAPIWERWADDPRLLRRALAFARADEPARAEQRHCLVAAVREMVPRRTDPGINAAVCAALCVLGGDMDTDFQAVAEQAVAKDAAAVRRTLARKESVGAATGHPCGPVRSAALPVSSQWPAADSR